jgi:hypothetical protein
MSNYHGRMVNIQAKHYPIDSPEWLDPAEEHGYRIGHRDARHAAAEIANEADTRIEELESQLEPLRRIAFYANKLDGGTNSDEQRRKILHAQRQAMESFTDDSFSELKGGQE